MKRILICLCIVVVVAASNIAFAEKPDKYKYLWSEKLPDAERFVLVFNEQAVLDKESGLVWERDAGTTGITWVNALHHCYDTVIDGRKGWRLPTVEELTSLIDPDQTNPALPLGHLFLNETNWFYLSSTADNARSNSIWGVHFGYQTPPQPELRNVHNLNKNDPAFNIICVRGGYGHNEHPQ